MRLRRFLIALSVSLPLAGCATTRALAPRDVLLAEDFNGENDRVYALNYTSFAQWSVTAGTVDLVGTAPFDDFLPTKQGLYVDLDGTAKAAGTLRSKTRFDLTPGTYRLEYKLAGTPRPNQPPNTVIVSLGDAFTETITLPSYAPLQSYTHTIRVRSRQGAHLTFEHLGGDDYGIFIDDIRLARL